MTDGMSVGPFTCTCEIQIEDTAFDVVAAAAAGACDSAVFTCQCQLAFGAHTESG
jgi:hypothetical protein